MRSSLRVFWRRGSCWRREGSCAAADPWVRVVFTAAGLSDVGFGTAPRSRCTFCLLTLERQRTVGEPRRARLVVSFGKLQALTGRREARSRTHGSAAAQKHSELRHLSLVRNALILLQWKRAHGTCVVASPERSSLIDAAKYPKTVRGERAGAVCHPDPVVRVDRPAPTVNEPWHAPRTPLRISWVLGPKHQVTKSSVNCAAPFQT
jgi:hypothetical protein